MPYMLRALNDCPTYICKTVEEETEALSNLIDFKKCSVDDVISLAMLFGVHARNPEAPPIEIMGIHAEHISEEEYEKWQKAF